MSKSSAPQATPPPLRCRLLIVGTDTAIGKTHVTATIVQGLRACGRRVWVHKPVSCGEWDGHTSGDGRALAALAGDGQPPETITPVEFAEDCSPHMAARWHDSKLGLADLQAHLERCDQGPHDLVCEGAGGLLAPLARDDCDITHLAQAGNLPCLLVTRPHLGTLNHTRCTVAVARARGIQLLGLIINHHQAGLDQCACSYAAAELQRLCQLPIVAELPYAPEPIPSLGKSLATDILRRQGVIS